MPETDQMPESAPETCASISGLPSNLSTTCFLRISALNGELVFIARDIYSGYGSLALLCLASMDWLMEQVA